MKRWCAVILVCAAAWPARGDEPEIVDVYSRGDDTGVIYRGEVTAVSLDGVSIRSESGRESWLVPWYELRTHREGWEVPEGYSSIHQSAAIGHRRRVRGDLSGMADLYMNLAPGLVGRDSEMAREVFGGLLDEAIVRGDLTDASVAWVALIQAGGGVGDRMNDRYGVHPEMPMIAGGYAEHRLSSLVQEVSDGDAVWGVLVRAFGVLEDSEVSEGEVLGVLSAMGDRVHGEGVYRQGMELCMQMLAAQRHPDARAREDAREWLGSRSRMMAGSWVDAWCRCGIGASLLYESGLVGGDDELVSRGVVELVHVMVRYGDELPGIARWAMEIAAGGLREVGRGDEAGELIKSFDMRMTNRDD